MDQGLDLSEKMRFEYSGNERVFGIVFTGESLFFGGNKC